MNDPFFEKGLPSNLEAERSILGAILLDNSVCNQAMEMMRRDDFFLDSHRRLFDKMILLSERGSSIDLVTLSEELRRANEFEQVGGATYIASLIDGVPRTDDISHYTKIVKDKAIFRQLITALEQSKTEAFDQEFEAGETKARALHRIENAGESDGLVKIKSCTLLKAEDLDKLPPVEWLIENEIPRNALALVYGESGTGKSFVALDYAVRISQMASVVYIAAEGGSGYGARLRAWRQIHNLPTERMYFYLDAVQMLNAAALRSFIRELRAVSPVLVVIDTLARCLIGGDENSAKDMGMFVDACARIQHEIGATVLIIHHKGKTASGPRGSSALFGAADSIIELANDDGLIQIRCKKMKDAKEFEARFLRLVETSGSCAVLPASKVLTDDAKLTDRQRQLLETLCLAIYEETGARYKQMQEITGLAASSLSYSLSGLKQKELVSQSKHGDPYSITEKGREALSSKEFQPDEDSGKENGFNNNAASLQALQSSSNGFSNGIGSPLHPPPTIPTPPLGVGIVGGDWRAGKTELEEGAL